MRVCYFGTYREEYSRNQIMIAGLRDAGVEVIECHVGLWTGIQDRIDAVTGGWRKPIFWFRVLTTYIRLLWKFLKVPDFDVLIVGYPGHFDVYLARILSNIRRKPLVWDVFMSIYLISKERALDRENPFTVWMLHKIEKAALKKPDLLIQDTAQYVQWYNEIYHISPERFVLVPTGADNRIFHPVQNSPAGDGNISQESAINVIYYGSFIPNHSVCTIVEAANLLKAEDIYFTLIGDGPDKPKARQMADQYQLMNIRFVGWLEKQDLIQYVNQTDIFLGAFGDTPQSVMTIQNKIFEGMAMRKPVITGSSVPLQEFFEHKRSIYLCDRRNAASLAEGILTLSNDQLLRNRIAENGYQIFCENFTVEALGKQYRSYLDELISSR